MTESLIFAAFDAESGRLSDILAGTEEPEPAGPGLVSATGYYRADQRFSAAENAGRVRSAQRGAAALPGAAARARDFTQVRQQVRDLLPIAPPGRVVRTRHGDRMLLTEFLRTRVLELAVHGLDLATALDQPPWMTPEAARVTAELLQPAASAARLRAAAGWDEVTQIAKLTGRLPVTPAETRLIESLGGQRLAFG